MRRRYDWHPSPFEPPRSWRRRWVRNLPATPWRWRWELGVPAGLEVLAESTSPLVAGGVVVASVVAGCGAGPGPRRWMKARVGAVVVQHRLRVGMAQCGLTSWSGRLPTILRTRVVDRGVRLTLWVPAGLDVIDFRVNASRLAAACWAVDVEIDRHPLRAQQVMVLVVTEHGAERDDRSDPEAQR